MMRCTRGWIVMGLSLALGACAGNAPDGSSDDDSTTPPPPGTPDAGDNHGSVDAGDNHHEPTYPPGPYGQAKGDIISDRHWIGYRDTAADPDSDPFNEPPHDIWLHDFYQGNDPRSRLLLTIQSAGWCGPCQEEAASLPNVTHMWQPKGINFMTAMWQNPDGSPGTTDYSKQWGTMFHQDSIVVADPDSLTGDGFGGSGIPFLILIDTKDMKILDFPWGADLPEVYQMYAQ